jgi:hypothetical protein
MFVYIFLSFSRVSRYLLNLREDSRIGTNALKNKVILAIPARLRETIGTIFEKSRGDFKKNYTSATQP